MTQPTPSTPIYPTSDSNSPNNKSPKQQQQNETTSHDGKLQLVTVHHEPSSFLYHYSIPDRNLCTHETVLNFLCEQFGRIDKELVAGPFIIHTNDTTVQFELMHLLKNYELETFHIYVHSPKHDTVYLFFKKTVGTVDDCGVIHTNGGTHDELSEFAPHNTHLVLYHYNGVSGQISDLVAFQIGGKYLMKNIYREIKYLRSQLETSEEAQDNSEGLNTTTCRRRRGFKVIEN